MEVEFDIDLVEFGENRTKWEKILKKWVWNTMIMFLSVAVL